MKLVIRDSAAADLEYIYAWTARQSPRAADAIVERLLIGCAAFCNRVWRISGVQAVEKGTREFIEWPYIIVYKVDDSSEEVIVLAVVHGRQRR